MSNQGANIPVTLPGIAEAVQRVNELVKAFRAAAKEANAVGKAFAAGAGTGGAPGGATGGGGGGGAGEGRIGGFPVLPLTTGLATMTALRAAHPFQAALAGLRESGSAFAAEQAFAERGGSSAMLASLRGATLGGVSDTTLMRQLSILRGALPNVSGGTIGQIFGNVARMGNIRGYTATESVERVTDAIAKLSTERLDELGIYVKLDEAVKRYADSLGKSNDALSSRERQEALLQAVLEQSNKSVETLGTKYNAATRAAEKYEAGIANITDALNRLTPAGGAALRVGATAGGEAALSIGSMLYASQRAAGRGIIASALEAVGAAASGGGLAGVLTALLSIIATQVVPVLGDLASSLAGTARVAAPEGPVNRESEAAARRRAEEERMRLMLGGR